MISFKSRILKKGHPLLLCLLIWEPWLQIMASGLTYQPKLLKNTTLYTYIFFVTLLCFPCLCRELYSCIVQNILACALNCCECDNLLMPWFNFLVWLWPYSNPCSLYFSVYVHMVLGFLLIGHVHLAEMTIISTNCSPQQWYWGPHLHCLYSMVPPVHPAGGSICLMYVARLLQVQEYGYVRLG